MDCAVNVEEQVVFYRGSTFSGNVLMTAVINGDEDFLRAQCKFEDEVNKVCRVSVRDNEYTLTALSFIGRSIWKCKNS